MYKPGMPILVLALGWGAGVDAQTYPARPIRVVIPFAPGGVSDLVLRAVADPVAAALGQPLVQDNRGGAGGTLAAEQVARAAPDGYTVMLGTGGNLAMAPSLYKSLAYDPQRDFAPIAMVARGQLMLVAHPSVPVASVQDLIQLAKKGGQLQIKYASSGVGSPPHLAGELFKSLTGTAMLHVPYKGSSPMLNDLVGGHVDMAFDSIATSLPHVRAGRLKALAVTGEKRSLAAPDLPTVAESGVSGFQLASFYAFVAPASTDKAIIERLAQEILAAAELPGTQKRLVGMGLEPAAVGLTRLAETLRTERVAWGRVIQAARIVPE